MTKIEVKMSPLTRLPVPLDLCAVGLEAACAFAGTSFNEITLLVTSGNLGTASGLAEIYGVRVMEVPEKFFPNPDQWAVIGPKSGVWSPGA